MNEGNVATVPSHSSSRGEDSSLYANDLDRDERSKGSVEENGS